jgi:hypothetical protein
LKEYFHSIVLVFIILITFLCGLAICPQSAYANDDAVPGEYIIKYKSGVDASAKLKLINAHGLEKRNDFKIIDAQVVKIPDNKMNMLNQIIACILWTIRFQRMNTLIYYGV